jgi:hypothetical protein
VLNGGSSIKRTLLGYQAEIFPGFLICVISGEVLAEKQTSPRINTARQSRNQNETSHHGDTENTEKSQKQQPKNQKSKPSKVKTAKQRTQWNFGAWRAVEKTRCEFKIVLRDTAESDC